MCCTRTRPFRKLLVLKGFFFYQDLSTFVLNSKGLFSDGMRQGLHGNLLYRKADLPAGAAVLGKAGGLFWTLFALNYFLLKVFLAFSLHCNCCLQGFSCAPIRVEPLLRYKESPSGGAEPRRKVTSRAILFTTLLDRILPVFAAGSESAPYIWLC